MSRIYQRRQRNVRPQTGNLRLREGRYYDINANQRERIRTIQRIQRERELEEIRRRFFVAPLPTRRTVRWPHVTQPNLDEDRSLIPFKSFEIKLRKCQKSAQCSICLGRINKSTKIPNLFCKHKFHQKCLKKWVEQSSNCPICRRNMGERI